MDTVYYTCAPSGCQTSADPRHNLFTKSKNDSDDVNSVSIYYMIMYIINVKQAV